jgi:hypothetical protein
MRLLCVIVLTIVFFGSAQAQDTAPPVKPETQHSKDSTLTTPTVDNGRFGKRYGNLADDDPLYTPRLAIWYPLLNIVAQELVLNTFDHYVLNLEFSKVSVASWGRNVKAGAPWGDGWKWDQDRFGNNFFFHPYTGVEYFDGARAAGYNFWESIPFAFTGSYLWKTFGENGKPEREDLINTTLGGMFGGEILYRISSNILNDQTSGTERLLREILAGILSPARFVTRLFEGDLYRTTTQEVYQKEPMNIAMYAGVHRVNDANQFSTGPLSEVFNLQLDYGDPFEHIDRKPYDFFKVRTDLNFGASRKLIDNVVGYGILFGKNVEEDKLSMLIGGFQEYDYWDNTTFELATLGFGAGVISTYPIFDKANLYTTLHLAIVPFGANNFRTSPDTTQVRDYNFGGGLQGKFESTLSLGTTVSASFIAYYYWFHSYIFDGRLNPPADEPGDSFIGILRPRITVGLTNSLSIGFEQMVYYNDRYSPTLPAFHNVRTEQRLFLQLFFENRKLDKTVTDIITK